MYKKILFIPLLVFLSGCASSSVEPTMSEEQVEQSLTEFSLDNIRNLVAEGRILKAMQVILSITEENPAYNDINVLFNNAIDEFELKYQKAVEEEDYAEAIKLKKSYLALGLEEKNEWEKLDDLYYMQILKLFNENQHGAALALLYDNLNYESLNESQLVEIERHVLSAGKKGALSDILSVLQSRSINASPESVRLLSDPFSIEEMIKGTVTVWVNKGIKIEDGIGIPDRVIGSGFFIDNSGHILTNYHVISSEVDPEYEGFSRLFIKLSDNSDERIPAKVVGWDNDFDLALLKAEVSPEYVFSISRTYEPSLGDQIFAIGSPGGLKNTMTSGTVSSLSRQLQPMGDSLQIDVPINPGNSGGPLLNSKGEVIGVVFAGIEQFEGVNFAIPVSDVRNSLPSMYNSGEVKHPWLGCGLFERSGQLEVLYVIPGSAADQVGLEKGDIISSVDGIDFKKIPDIQRYVISHDPQTLIRVNWHRQSGSFSAVLSLDDRPDEPMELALERDIIDNLLVPFFGMEVERISGRGKKNILFSISDVYPGSTADEAGLSDGDTVLLRKWQYLSEKKAVVIQIIMKSRKAGYIESAVQIGTYIIKGFMI